MKTDWLEKQTNQFQKKPKKLSLPMGINYFYEYKMVNGKIADEVFKAEIETPEQKEKIDISKGTAKKFADINRWARKHAVTIYHAQNRKKSSNPKEWLIEVYHFGVLAQRKEQPLVVFCKFIHVFNNIKKPLIEQKLSM